MTAINVILAEDAAHVFTDGAGIAPDGRLLGLVSKIRVLTHLDAVLALRGGHFLASDLVASLAAAMFRSFDHLVAGAGDVMRRQIAEGADVYEADPFGVGLDLVIAGWNRARGRAECWFASSDEANGAPAWRALRVASPFASPCDGSIAEWIGAQRWPVPASDMAARGLELTKRQRDLPNGGGVGGFVQQTTVTETGITTRILERWADKLGEPIRPIHRA